MRCIMNAHATDRSGGIFPMVFGARARRPCHWSWAAGIVAIWVLVSLAQVFAVGEEACIMVYFQAHRGGLEEVPENTLVA
ncbi:MAG TPA: hypothetical protein PKL84_18030, partial [Candidatus Hydrogenedentes bacterium]|nr:hypothetical protein [Candidatus Hydrogenedentota bacterium]